MKKLLFLIGLMVFMLPVLAQAQETPKSEVFAGYSYTRFKPGDLSVNANGLVVSITGNANKYFGLMVETAVQRGSVETSLRDFYDDPSLPNTRLKISGNLFTVMAGPRVTARTNKVTVFAHALFGSGRLSAEGNSDTSLAFAIGGGLDVNLSQRVALRLVQADYLCTNVFQNQQNNFRYSAGIVFRFGQK